MEKEYVLKHKEIPVIIFKMDDESFALLDVHKVFDKKRLPFRIDDTHNVIQCGIKLNSWIKGRGLADSRKDLHKVQNLFNAKNKEELIVGSYGLNLTDHYWIHKTEENLSWRDLNYFDNKFDKLQIGTSQNPSIDESVGNKSPNFCVDGSIEKRWVIKDDNTRVLLKGSRYMRMQEPFNELIASRIMDLFNIDHVRYTLRRTKGTNIPYSECKCMVDTHIEYINAHHVMESGSYERKDPYIHFLETCQKNGINDVKEKIDTMLCMDFILGNEDRHRGNFGILRNSETLEWLKIAPVFDNGNCLFFDRENEDMENWGIDSLGKAFGDSNRLCLNNVDYPLWYDENKIDIITGIINNELNNNERLNSKRIEKIIDITKERIKIFKKIAGGKN